MTPDLVARYSVPVPRYTSYPTAPHFHDGIDAARYRRWLAALGAEARLSLYLHVPFCDRMCWYCGCHTKVVKRYEPVARYAGLLRREVALAAEAMAARPKVSHVHWGGGTPTMLSPADFVALMAELRGTFAFEADAEVAVEIDPRVLDGEKVDALAEAGVTRASLGVQDFTPSVQAAINRIQPYEQTAAVVESLRAAGIARLNLDLMYGLPGQSPATLRETVDLALQLEPDRLALFGYAHVPWMKTHQRLIDESALPAPFERLSQAEAAAERLSEKGYRRIGLDHFARSDDPMAAALDAGRLRRNFQGYTTDDADALLGFGASAIGALPQGYIQNAVPLSAYRAAVESGELAVTRGLALTTEDCARRAIIERLMCDLEVDLAQLAGDEPSQRFGPELAALDGMARDDLVAIEGARVAVTERGRPFLRSVCAQFDSYLTASPARHSSGV
ncbi:MAG: oxygen-independent coproporphyrinogen III oxidase [Kiloniellales bacterium]|nr:oxygen-independent coproporphyrinogen III oxidase [Kiloniellales bacterium]